VPAAPVMAEIEGTIHVLLIDDNPHDAELCLMALRRAKLAVESVTVSDEQELRAGLLTFVPDVILCDLNFPNFDGLSAQRIVREICGDTPLIFVSGSISEDLAVLALQSGAVDYVSKMSLTRLPSAVQRAVRAARLAAYAEARAREHSRRLEALWVIANNAKLRGLHLIAAILREAGSTLGPPLMFRGMLGRIENDEVVGISIGLNPDAGDTRGNHIVDGIRTPLSDTIIPRVGRTQGLARHSGHRRHSSEDRGDGMAFGDVDPIQCRRLAVLADLCLHTSSPQGLLRRGLRLRRRGRVYVRTRTRSESSRRLPAR
jgi:CheY-like chemotaxis protein